MKKTWLNLKAVLLEVSVLDSDNTLAFVQGYFILFYLFIIGKITTCIELVATSLGSQLVHRKPTKKKKKLKT